MKALCEMQLTSLALPSCLPTFQILDEHLKVFGFNNTIIATFPIGWWASARGLVCLVPPMTRYALLMVAVAAPSFWLMNRRAA